MEVVSGVNGLRYVDPDYLPLAVAIDVLGHGFTSRLTTQCAIAKSLTYSMRRNWLAPVNSNKSQLFIQATFAPSLTIRGLSGYGRLVRDGITQAELDYRKSSLARRSR